jgi:polyhydroxybutyrate depolymerase
VWQALDLLKAPKPAGGRPLAAPLRSDHPEKITKYASKCRDIQTSFGWPPRAFGSLVSDDDLGARNRVREAAMKRALPTARRAASIALVVVIVAALGAVVATALGRKQGVASASSRPAPIVYRPPGLRRSRPVALVVALNASGGVPATFETTSGLDAVADQHGFVVAYLGSLAPTSPAWLLGDMPQNLAYIGSEIKSLTVSENIDPKRVYVTGFSAGATMAYFVGCQLSSLVDGIAPVSGAMRFTDPCHLSHPVSELDVIGTRDAIPIAGTTRLLSDEQVSARWRRLDGCASRSSSAVSGTVTERTWSQCKGSSGVGLYVIQNGTHQWPGPQASGTDAQFAAASAVWAFFDAHP